MIASWTILCACCCWVVVLFVALPFNLSLSLSVPWTATHKTVFLRSAAISWLSPLASNRCPSLTGTPSTGNHARHWTVINSHFRLPASTSYWKSYIDLLIFFRILVFHIARLLRVYRLCWFSQDVFLEGAKKFFRRKRLWPSPQYRRRRHRNRAYEY